CLVEQVLHRIREIEAHETVDLFKWLDLQIHQRGIHLVEPLQQLAHPHCRTATLLDLRDALQHTHALLLLIGKGLLQDSLIPQEGVEFGYRRRAPPFNLGLLLSSHLPESTRRTTRLNALIGALASLEYLPLDLGQLLAGAKDVTRKALLLLEEPGTDVLRRLILNGLPRLLDLFQELTTTLKQLVTPLLDRSLEVRPADLEPLDSLQELTTGLDRLANRRLVSPLRRCHPSIGAGYVLAELTLLLEPLQLGVSDLLFELGLALRRLLALAGNLLLDPLKGDILINPRNANSPTLLRRGTSLL